MQDFDQYQTQNWDTQVALLRHFKLFVALRSQECAKYGGGGQWEGYIHSGEIETASLSKLDLFSDAFGSDEISTIFEKYIKKP